MALFPVESSVTQLRPETIAQLVGEAEERQWTQLGVPEEKDEGECSSPINGSTELGQALLRHGKCVRRIQSYFSHMESRKCCLALAGRKSIFSNVRVVRNDGKDNGLEEGAMKRTVITLTKDVQQLDNKEFRAFKHSYLCAAFPVLGAPDPPSPVSPSTPPEPASSTLTFVLPRTGRRPSTPLSLHDSGVEETDEGAMIPTETLCELLRRGFRLSTERFHQYESMIVKSYQKKSPPKLLAEELGSQLMAIENDSNSFYHPSAFCSQTGYEIWKGREMPHIFDLFNKFWHMNLPFPSDSQLHAKDLATVHEDYEILLSKLLQYEHQFKVGTEDTSSPLFNLLSSASLRLLKEFGLRYGIGELYRRILYLRHLISMFSPTVWYLQHMTSVITSILDLLPTNKTQNILTKKEFMLLDSCIKSILVQASKSFCQMKSIFQSIKPADGIDILINLISTILELKTYLFKENHETLDKFLYRAVQGIFRPTYDRYKALAMSEIVDKAREETICPILLNILIGNIRDEVTDYRTNYQSSFADYVNITEDAAQSFYILLMEDVHKLCVLETITNPDEPSREINLLMAGLAYRLNRLDQDWSEYIPIEAQHWRKCFLPEVLKWSSAIRLHVEDLVLETVSSDKFQTQELHLTTPLSSLLGSATPSRSMSSVPHKSLTPSSNSAFSSIVSSVRSTPCKQLTAVDSPSKQAKHPATIRETSPEDASSPVQDSSKPVHSEKLIVKLSKRGSFDTKSLNEVEDEEKAKRSSRGLTQSVSLPDMKEQAESQEDTMDSCPFMPLLNESDEISSKSSEYSMEGTRTKSDTEGSGIVFNTCRESHRSSECSDQEGKIFAPQEDESDDTSTVASTMTDSEGEESENEDDSFHFPPIQIVSEGSGRPFLPSEDHSLPPHPQDMHSGFLSRVVSAFTSRSHTSSGTHSGDGDHDSSVPTRPLYGEYNVSLSQHQDFMDSLSSEFSNISLPTPPPGSEAKLPVSGSAIDMVVTMQRLVSIGHTFYEMLYPTLDDLETLEAVDCGDLSMEQLELYRNSIDGKEKIYTNFLKTICNTACLYADNMLCIDLCGTPQATAKRVIGPMLVEHLHRQRKDNLIWGCRHEAEGSGNCTQYIKKETSYLCDRYEAITQQMCTRVNNVSAILRFLELYERRLASMFGEKDVWPCFEDLLKKVQTRSGRESCYSTADFMAEEQVEFEREETGNIFTEVPCPSSPLSLKLLDPHQSHLIAVLKAMCRLIAYRLNLFLHDALRLLLQLKPPQVTIQDCLKPVTSFLQTYLQNLGGWLYKDCFHQVLECLWIFLVQDLEVEADKLRTEEGVISSWPQTILQALTHLLKFMNNFGKGITRNLLLSQADDLIFKLQLYTLSTHHLLAVYSKLKDFSLSDRGMFPHEIVKPAPTVIVQKIQRDLQRFRKCFSGKDLVRWIFRHRDLFYRIEPAMVERGQSFCKETVIEIIYKLLDLHYITDLEDVTDESRSVTPTQGVSGYPEVSIHTQFEGTTLFDDQHTPTISPEGGDSRTSFSSHTEETIASSGVATPVPDGHNVHDSLTVAAKVHSDISSGSTVSGSRLRSEVSQAAEGSGSQLVSSGSTFSGSDISELRRVKMELDVRESGSRNRTISDDYDSDKVCETSLSDDHTKIQNSSDSSRGARYDTHFPRNTQSKRHSPPSDFTQSDDHGLKTNPLPFNKQLISCMSDRLSRSTLITPLSFRSDNTYTLSVDSSSRFFYVVPHSVEDLSHEDRTTDAFTAYSREHSQRFFRLSRARETADMVETCFQKKVKPVFLMTILYSRRKTDPVAKEFVRLLPNRVIETIKYHLNQPAMDSA